MISILMATYNGEDYLAEQLDSLLNQTFQDFKLILNDDNSTDNTLSIAQGYAEKYPGKIYVTQNEINTGSAKNNFFDMILRYKNECDYFMLCDQDDVWLPEKIEKSYNKIEEMEQMYGSSVPILVHTDLTVVDNNLNVISPSYEKMAHTRFANNKLNNLITMNVAAGCTSIFNKALVSFIDRKPDFVVMHDWWLALVATSFGKIATIYEPTILYRQHKRNELGAKKVLSLWYIRYFLTHMETIAEKVNNSYKQAESFLSYYYDKLSDEQRNFLKTYASIPKLSKLQKIRTTAKLNAKMYGLSRRFARTIVILTERQS